MCRANETNKIVNTVKAHTTVKTNNIEKKPLYCSNDKKIDSLNRLIRSQKSSDCHDMEGVEFLDHINFDNGHFDDNAINYIEESI